MNFLEPGSVEGGILNIDLLKIAIRPAEFSDAQAVFDMAQESIETTYPFQAWCHPNYSLEDARIWTSQAEALRSDGREHHSVVYSLETGELLGTTALIRFNQYNGVAETGYFVRESARAQGVGTRACYLTALFAFQELKLRRLEIIIAKHNHKSRRVAEKIGAHYEGILKERLKWNAEFHDAFIYSLFLL